MTSPQSTGSVTAKDVYDIVGSLGVSPAAVVAAVGGVPWTVVTKSADESVASSVAVQNDDELFFTPVNGAVYEVELAIVYANPVGGGTPDMKWTIGDSFTGTAQGQWIGISDSEVATAAVVDAETSLRAGTATFNRLLKVWAVVNGNGFVFRFKWAQSVSDANPTIVRAGSVLRYRRIA